MNFSAVRFIIQFYFPMVSDRWFNIQPKVIDRADVVGEAGASE